MPFGSWQQPNLFVDFSFVLEMALLVKVLHVLIGLAHDGDHEVEHDDVDEEDDEEPDGQNQVVGNWVRRCEFLTKITQGELED